MPTELKYGVIMHPKTGIREGERHHFFQAVGFKGFETKEAMENFIRDNREDSNLEYISYNTLRVSVKVDIQ